MASWPSAGTMGGGSTATLQGLVLQVVRQVGPHLFLDNMTSACLLRRGLALGFSTY